MNNPHFNTEIGCDLSRAIEILNEGNLVAIPTETVYGLAGNGLSESAILKIFEAKNRPFFDPLILHIGNTEMLHELVSFIPESCNRLIQKFWPGPLTVILPKKEIVPDLVTSGSDFVAVRMPKHELTLQLLNSISFPLAAPSANPFKYVSPTTAMHVHQQLQGKIPYILNGGDCKIGIESTIVSFMGDAVKIQRLGGIALEEILKELPDAILANQPDEHPVAPGQLKHHYAPGCKLIPFENILWGDNYEFQNSEKIGAVMFESLQKTETEIKLNNMGISSDQIQWFVLSESGNSAEAAQNLFSALRKLDNEHLQWAIFRWAPEKELGLAINDRLKKAQYLPI
jgi:L-threonylcarbamoyladenylate synthase